MKFSKNQIFAATAIVLLSFLSILSVEAFHHHGEMESNDDCSICSFQLTSSHAPSLPQPPLLLPFVVVFALFVFSLLFTRIVVVSARGRSPPQILL